MTAQQIVFALVTFLHDLFTTVWVGGLLTLGLTVLPSARKVLGAGPQTKQLMQVIQKRLSVLVYVSIVVLFVTGALKAYRSPAFQGLFNFANPYSVVLTLKHILVFGMIAVAVIRSSVLRSQGSSPTPSREKLGAVLLFLNMFLGILVLLFSAFSVALSAGTPPL